MEMVFLQIQKTYLEWYDLKYTLGNTEGLTGDDPEGHLSKGWPFSNKLKLRFNGDAEL